MFVAGLYIASYIYPEYIKLMTLHILGNAVNGQDGYDQQNHQENFNPAGSGRYSPPPTENQVPSVQPPRREREYNWKLTGATECSASCGKGQLKKFMLSFFFFFLVTERVIK